MKNEKRSTGDDAKTSTNSISHFGRGRLDDGSANFKRRLYYRANDDDFVFRVATLYRAGECFRAIVSGKKKNGP